MVGVGRRQWLPTIATLGKALRLVPSLHSAVRRDKRPPGDVEQTSRGYNAHKLSASAQPFARLAARPPRPPRMIHAARRVSKRNRLQPAAGRESFRKSNEGRFLHPWFCPWRTGPTASNRAAATRKATLPALVWTSGQGRRGRASERRSVGAWSVQSNAWCGMRDA